MWVQWGTRVVIFKGKGRGGAYTKAPDPRLRATRLSFQTLLSGGVKRDLTARHPAGPPARLSSLPRVPPACAPRDVDAGICTKERTSVEKHGVGARTGEPAAVTQESAPAPTASGQGSHTLLMTKKSGRRTPPGGGFQHPSSLNLANPATGDRVSHLGMGSKLRSPPQKGRRKRGRGLDPGRLFR